MIIELVYMLVMSTWQPGSVLMFFHNILLRIASLDTLFLCAVGQQDFFFFPFKPFQK